MVTADLIVLATGYKGQEHLVARLFGEEVAARVGPIWSSDTARNCARCSAAPASRGSCRSREASSKCRIYSKYLALQIAAVESGVWPRTSPPVAKRITGAAWSGPRFFGLVAGAGTDGAGPLRDLHPQVLRRGAGAGLQFARCPARGLRRLHRQPGPEGWVLLPDPTTTAGSPAARSSARRCSGFSPTSTQGGSIVVVYKIDRLTRSLATSPRWWSASTRRARPSSR